MRMLREAATDGLHVVVFDPAALTRQAAVPADVVRADFAPAGVAPRAGADRGARREVDLDDLEAWAEEGALVLWETPGDGAYTLALYVDEPVDEAYVARTSAPLAERLLRVPSGRLRVEGAEGLDVLAAEGGWPEADGVVVAPGDYAVTAFEVVYTEADERAFKAELRAEAGAWRVRLLDAVGVAGAVLAMATIAVGIPAVVLLVARPALFLDGLLRVGPWFLVAWLLVLAASRLPYVARVDAARERLERERPVAVVALRRLADDEPRPALGAAIGGDYGEEWA